jgi:hypothetical protein
MIIMIEGDEASGWKPGKPTLFQKNAVRPAFSPDGRWLAYQFNPNQTESSEIFVQSFQNSGNRWQVSSGGGQEPVWSRTRNELLFGRLDPRSLLLGYQLMVARYTIAGNSLQFEKPQPWAAAHVVKRGGGSFDLHPDGERVVFAPVHQTIGSPTRDKIVFIFNFFDELRRLAPATPR